MKKDVLGDIRPGDANSLRFIIGQIETGIVNAKLDPSIAMHLPTLRRYQAMAKQMEDEL